MEPTLEDFETHDVDESRVERSLLLIYEVEQPLLPTTATREPEPTTPMPPAEQPPSNIPASSEDPLLPSAATALDPEPTPPHPDATPTDYDHCSPRRKTARGEQGHVITKEGSSSPPLKHKDQPPSRKHLARPQTLPSEQDEWADFILGILPEPSPDLPGDIPQGLEKGDTICGWFVNGTDEKGALLNVLPRPMVFLAQVIDMDDNDIIIRTKDQDGTMYRESLLCHKAGLRPVAITRLRHDGEIPLYMLAIDDDDEETETQTDKKERTKSEEEEFEQQQFGRHEEELPDVMSNDIANFGSENAEDILVPGLKNPDVPSSMDTVKTDPPSASQSKSHRKHNRKERERGEGAKHKPPTDPTSLDWINEDTAQCTKATFWMVPTRKDKELLARALREAIGGFSTADDTAKQSMWLSWFAIPQQRLQKFEDKAFKMLRLQLKKRPLPTQTKPAPLHTNGDSAFEERRLNAARTYALNGFMGKSARMLERKQLPLPPDTDTLLKQLHPEGEPLLAPRPSKSAIIAIDTAKLLEVTKSQATMKSPGPSSWTEDLIYQAIDTDATLMEDFAAMIADICNAQIPNRVKPIILASRLIAIAKEDGGIRPIAIGEAILKIAEAYLLSLAKNNIADELEPIQLAFKSKGTEEIIHASRKSYDEGKSIISIDCTNAFNTIKRTKLFAALQSTKSDIRTLFAPILWLEYAFPTRLHNNFMEKLYSREGVRQGSVLASLFFCLGLHPVLQSLSKRYPSAKFLAFMDDISVICDDTEVDKIFLELTTALKEIGLAINARKTFVLAQAASANIRIPIRQTSGAKILGAWIGGETEKFLHQQLAKSETFVTAVQQLEPYLALPVLQSCGIPRLNYICRTHHPRDTAETAKTFDNMIDTALRNILEIDGQLSDDQKIVRHLPMKTMGGLAITRYEFIHEEAYNASIDPFGQDQYTRVKQINKKLFEKLPPQWQEFLSQTRKAHASLFLQRTTSDSSAFQRSVKLRLQCFPAEFLKKCVCGFNCDDSKAYYIHALGCSKIHGTNVSWRHSVIKFCIANFCKQNTVPIAIEPFLTRDSVGTMRRCDLLVETNDADLYLDVTVANSLCASHRKKSDQELAEEKSLDKEGKYLQEVNARGGKFFTVMLHALGGFSREARQAIERIELSCNQRGELSSRLSVALQRANGKILLNAWRWAENPFRGSSY